MRMLTDGGLFRFETKWQGRRSRCHNYPGVDQARELRYLWSWSSNYRAIRTSKRIREMGKNLVKNSYMTDKNRTHDLPTRCPERTTTLWGPVAGYRLNPECRVQGKVRVKSYQLLQASWLQPSLLTSPLTLTTPTHKTAHFNHSRFQARGSTTFLGCGGFTNTVALFTCQLTSNTPIHKSADFRVWLGGWID